MNSQFDDYKRISTLDFANNKKQLALSYLIRLIGVAVFTLLFVAIIRVFHPELPATLGTFFNIGLEGASQLVSYLLVAVSVVLVLLLHELVHAAVFYLDQHVPPQIGWRGLTIFAAAPGFLSTRKSMVINALAPFTVISILGLTLIAILPVDWVSWIFIPIMVNAAAAGGDFMTVVWLRKLPEDAKIEDNGDVLTAYAEEQ